MIYIDNEKTYDFSAHKMPVFYEKKNVDWLMWGYCVETYKDAESKQWDNLQPDYYEWLYNSSSKHRSIINRKTLFINGKGVKGDYNNLEPSGKAELGSFVFGINHSEIVKKWSLNLTKIGGFCYEVIPEKNGKKIGIHYVNLKNIRRSKPSYDSEGREEPVKYYYTRDWKAKKPEDNPDFTTFHEWDYTDNFDRNKRYLVLYSEDEENLYPIPEYTAAVPYIAADYEVGNFTYNNTKNAFAGSYLINFFNGDLQEDQKAEIVESIKAKLYGTDNSGEPVVSFQDIDVPGVTIEPLAANGQDDRFLNLNKQIREEIFAGHTINPIVVGLEGASGFNNNADEERTATEHFKKYYIQGKQIIIEKHLNAVRMFNGIKGEVFIQDLDPVEEQVSEAELTAILTEDERRERAGYEPKTEEQKTQTIKETIKETERQFKAEEDTIITDYFMSHGLWDEKENFTIVRNRDFFAENIEDAQRQEFASALELLILTLLTNKPDISLEDIAKASKTTVEEVERAIANLNEEGLLDGQSPTGETVEEPEFFIVYKYEKADNVNGASVISTTRPFCRTMVNLSKFKSWTLEDIKGMNNGTGLDVFLSRGGWYRVPGTDRSVPRCRHIWKQLLVKRNG